MAGSQNRSSTQGQARFAYIPSADIPRSTFDRSCGVKTTFDSGDLIPIFVDEALPGDTMNLQVNTYARMATLLHPIMDNQTIETQWFAVPCRLLWDNWQAFMGEKDNPDDDTTYLVPTITQDVLGGQGGKVGGLPDYMGIPPEVEGIEYNALHMRAYNLIWKEWYRSENLQDSPPINTGDGPDTELDYTVLKRGKKHDYFTSCMPWPQKGPAVELGFGQFADVVPKNNSGQNAIPQFGVVGGVSAGALQTDSSQSVFTSAFTSGGLADMKWGTTAGDTGLQADLSTATANTINNIREAFATQRMYERDSRGGTRYTEVLRSHFGVVSPDARLQRPEFLGSTTQKVNINPVAQTADTGQPVGQLGAFVTSSHSGRGWIKSFTEHCVVIGLASVRTDLNYQQGLNRMWSRQTRFDYYWPAFSHLGEQAVFNKEIFAQGNEIVDNFVFGYQEAWAEMRYKPSMITAKMRSLDADDLDTWHLAQDFASVPVLGEIFIQEDPPVERVIAVPSEPEWIFDAYFSFKHTRPMPTYSVPGLIDHF